MGPSTNNTEAASEQIRLEWQEIARTQVIRNRRKLGSLSPEQEAAVESVFVCVVNQLFAQLSLETAPPPLRLRWLKMLRPDAVAV